jgi:hypothetical protein
MVRPRLPPLNAIKAFEAAARLGSFTRAAEELNVTHGAVSRQIRALEDWLGVRLFVRTSRNAVPTRAGTDLLAEAGPALDRLAYASLRVQSGAQARGLLHVSALPTFAMPQSGRPIDQWDDPADCGRHRHQAGRAKRHISDLNDEISAFLKRDPYRIVLENNAETRKLSWIVRITEELSDQVPLIIGDAGGRGSLPGRGARKSA